MEYLKGQKALFSIRYTGRFRDNYSLDMSLTWSGLRISCRSRVRGISKQSEYSMFPHKEKQRLRMSHNESSSKPQFKKYIKSPHVSHVCLVSMLKQSIGYSPSQLICLCHSSQMECRISKDNLKKEARPDIDIGSCLFVSHERYACLELRMCSELKFTQNQQGVKPQMIMSGKKRRALLEPVSNWEPSRSIVTPKTIGTPSGPLPSPEILRVSQPALKCPATPRCPRSRRITSSQSPKSDKSKCLLDQQVLESPVALGTRLRTRRIRKIRIPSSGMDIKVNPTLSSTSFAARLISAISSVGPTDTPSQLRQKEAVLCSQLAAFGSLAISTPETGTRTLTKRQKMP